MIGIGFLLSQTAHPINQHLKLPDNRRIIVPKE
jgi:hypothetical protein